MSKYLIVVDMQNDFIDGALGTREAQAIVPKVLEKSGILRVQSFLPGIPTKKIIWKPRKGKNFRWSTVSVEQRDGSSRMRLRIMWRKTINSSLTNQLSDPFPGRMPQWYRQNGSDP